MPVTGNSNNGIFKTNSDRQRITSIVTVEELKESYIFGINFDSFDGKTLSDKTLQLYIDNAISNLEHHLDIDITPKNIIENQDYYANQYADWAFFTFQNYPVLKINTLKLIYFRDDSQDPQTVIEIPDAWFRLENHSGVVRLIPNSRFVSKFQVGQNGYLFPQLLNSPHIPHLWEVDYVAGFDHGKVPYLVNQAIALLAAVQALIVAGNLALGAGIASESLSIDNLSQTITTTASAENSAYSATIREYQRQLYGTRQGDENSIIRKLKSYYKGTPISVI